MALTIERVYNPARMVWVRDEDGEMVYQFSMATMKNGHYGGALTEAEWQAGEKQALALAKEMIDGRND